MPNGRGGRFADIYEDVSSGAKASRPALNRPIDDARARKFDCLLVWKLDRFGRSLVDCLKHKDPGGERHPVHRGHSRIGYGSPESGVAISVACAGRRSRVLTGTDSGADASRPVPLQAGFRERQGGQDGLQPVRAEPATPPSQESIRPGQGTPVTPPRVVISSDCEVCGLRTGDGRPDAAAVFQRLVVGIWNRGSGQGRLLPSGVIRTERLRSVSTSRHIGTNPATLPRTPVWRVQQPRSSASSRSNPDGAHSSGVIRNVYRGLNRASSVRASPFCGSDAAAWQLRRSRGWGGSRRSHTSPCALAPSVFRLPLAPTASTARRGQFPVRSADGRPQRRSPPFLPLTWGSLQVFIKPRQLFIQDVLHGLLSAIPVRLGRKHH